MASLEFLRTFDETVKGRSKQAMAQRKWITEWRKKILDELKVPTGKGCDTKVQAAALLSASMGAGGAKVLDKT